MRVSRQAGDWFMLGRCSDDSRMRKRHTRET